MTGGLSVVGATELVSDTPFDGRDVVGSGVGSGGVGSGGAGSAIDPPVAGVRRFATYARGSGRPSAAVALGRLAGAYREAIPGGVRRRTDDLPTSGTCTIAG